MAFVDQLGLLVYIVDIVKKYNLLYNNLEKMLQTQEIHYFCLRQANSFILQGECHRSALTA